MDLKVYRVTAQGRSGKIMKKVLRFPCDSSFKKYVDTVKKMFSMKIILDK